MIKPVTYLTSTFQSSGIRIRTTNHSRRIISEVKECSLILIVLSYLLQFFSNLTERIGSYICDLEGLYPKNQTLF